MIQLSKPPRSKPGIYKADLTAGSLKIPESRIVADLLLRNFTPEEWKTAVYSENILQSKTYETSRRLANLIRSRLQTMEPPLWKLIRDGKGNVATHAALAAAVKHSQLLGDFLQFVVAEQYRLFSPTLSHRNFADFLETCRERDPEMQQWNESTCKRLRSSVFQILAQAGYIDSTRGWKSFDRVYSIRCKTNDSINDVRVRTDWNAYNTRRTWWRDVHELGSLNQISR